MVASLHSLPRLLVRNAQDLVVALQALLHPSRTTQLRTQDRRRSHDPHHLPIISRML